MIVTRFAPSPNGPLHLGHAYSAITAHDLAREAGGIFLLRIEDIDGARSCSEQAQRFRGDLAWLGLTWREVAPQSQRIASYRAAAQQLMDRGLLYRCKCSRADVVRAQAAAGITDGRYPGTCRHWQGHGEEPLAWRLDAAKAYAAVCADANVNAWAASGPLEWHDAVAGPQTVDPATLDDVVIMRKDAPASYHLAVTMDDAADGVTLVTRGRDLFDATRYHRLVQALLGLPVPRWHHHALLLDDTGQKLAKRRHSLSFADRRAAGEDGPALADLLRSGNLPAGISLDSA